MVRIQREIRFLTLIRNDHIVKLLQAHETSTQIILVMEYICGGELLSYICRQGRLSEVEARRIFRQLTHSVDYCHRNSIVHRDIKPENVLLDMHNDIKLTDFGFSNFFDKDNVLDTFCGSPLYAAPEMIMKTPYVGPEVDLWSMGVLLYAMTTGLLPFDEKSPRDLYARVISGDYVLPTNLSQGTVEKRTSNVFHLLIRLFSDLADLIHRLLVVNPSERATMSEVLNHSWVNCGYSSPPNPRICPRSPVSVPQPRILKLMERFGFPSVSLDKLASPQESSNRVRSAYYMLLEIVGGSSPETEQDHTRLQHILQSPMVENFHNELSL